MSSKPHAAQQEQSRTEAERVVRARQLLDRDTARRKELDEERSRLDTEFERLSAQFQKLDRERTAPQHGRKPTEQSDQPARSKEQLEADWTRSRDSLNLVIRRRRVVQQQWETLDQKIVIERDYLRRLTEPEAPADPVPAVAVPDALPKSPADSQPAAESKATPSHAKGVKEASVTGDQKQNTVLAATDERVAAARKDREAKQEELTLAQSRLEFIDRSLDVFQRDLENSQTSLATLKDEIQAAEISPDAPAAATDGNPSAAASSRQEVERIRAAVRREEGVINETQVVMERLRRARDKAATKVTEAEQALSRAQTWLLVLESPLSPSRVFRWVTENGPKVLGVLVIVTLLWALSLLFERRVISGLMSRRRTDAEHQGRAETLRRVFRSFCNVTLVILGGLAVLDQAGVNVTVLLGGAAVVGAAIAFGAQNLIRDYFSGFMVLVENQYNVGSVISVGAKSGVVEDITLRMTALRDEEGVIHFVPHSQLTIVSNMTHGWARAVVPVTVDYREDVDHVMQVLMDLAHDLRQDREFGHWITEPPELQGVDNLSESAVRVKVLLKTRPMQQWAVKREYLRRIKNRFDELGIQFAFPQQVVHVDGRAWSPPQDE